MTDPEPFVLFRYFQPLINKLTTAWQENPVFMVTREDQMPSVEHAIHRFFEKFVLRGQVLLDRAEQEPDPDARRELEEDFCRYFETYLRDVHPYVTDTRVAYLHEAHAKMMGR